MSAMPKCQALHIVRSCLWYFYNFCRFRRVISTLTKPLNFCGSFFYINICDFISMGKFLYETRIGLFDNSYLRYKVQLPTSDSTETTAGGIKVTLRGSCTPRRPLAEKKTFILNVSSCSSFRGSKNYIRGPCATWTPLTEKNIPKSSISQYLISIFNF